MGGGRGMDFFGGRGRGPPRGGRGRGGPDMGGPDGDVKGDEPKNL